MRTERLNVRHQLTVRVPCQIKILHPFTQRLTVNASIKKDDHAKQILLLFVLMLGRKKGDYRRVLMKQFEILPLAPAVWQITLDFEKAIWSALKKVIPNVKLQRCAFHWTQVPYEGWRMAKSETCWDPCFKMQAWDFRRFIKSEPKTGSPKIQAWDVLIQKSKLDNL